MEQPSPKKQTRSFIRFSPFMIALLLMVLLLLSRYILVDPEQPVHWGGYISMVFFYGLIFYVGGLAAKSQKSKTAEELILASRSLPLGIAMMTMAATWVGGGYINGTAEYTASYGLAWAQAPWAYALSLIIGGIFFARPMRRHGFTTMLDPFHVRFGKKMAAVLYLPALMGEIFWTAAILTALGTTFGTLLGLNFTSSIVMSALVAISYTALGGLKAVAFTDVIQLLLLITGLWITVPYAMESVGGFSQAFSLYYEEKGMMSYPFPPWDGWRYPEWGIYYWNWWDFALLLIFGGIPWHVYFQRVLSSRNENTAMWLSIWAGVFCIVAAIPAALIGIVGTVADWQQFGVEPPEEAALVLPYVFRYLTNPVISTIGLGALAAAVMSSVDSSILSASSMGAWNVYRPLINPNCSSQHLTKIIKRIIWVIGISATLIALKIESVYALWFLCSDFVYCILFPQLFTVLFDKKANRIGSFAGFLVSFFLRIGGGEPTLGIPEFLPYPMVAEDGTICFPFRTFSMLMGLSTIIVVSRLTQKRCPSVPLDSKVATQ